MNLYAFGSNGSGQLSLSHKDDVSTPTKCIFETPAPASDDEITTIVAGGNHTLLLTNRGYVFAAGFNGDGRCGLQNRDVSGIETEKNEPRNVYEDDENGEILRFRRVVLRDSLSGLRVDTFKAVSATWEGSLLVASIPVLTSEGTDNEISGLQQSKSEDRIFVMGSSPKGELGLGPDSNGTYPVQPGISIPDFPPLDTAIHSLASGMGHSVVVLSNGDVYGWGGSRKGQLGEGLKDAKIVWSPAKIEGIPFPATRAVCGREFTVVLGRMEKGEFMVLGDKRNRWGISDVPGELSRGAKGFKDIGATWHGVYVHATGSGPESGPGVGPVVAWGRNDRGQLPPADLPPVAKLAVGSEHVLALLHDGSVAAFGWGEHGNCGPETDCQGNVSGSYKTIPLPEEVHASGGQVVDVGAGCATSWLIVK